MANKVNVSNMDTYPGQFSQISTENIKLWIEIKKIASWHEWAPYLSSSSPLGWNTSLPHASDS